MARDLDAATSTGLQQGVVRPVVIVWLDILGDPLWGWTGPGVFVPVGTGDSDLDGNIFIAAEGPIDISDMTEDQSIGQSVTLSMRSDDLTAPLMRQIVANRSLWHGRRAKIWLGLLSSDERTILGAPFAILDGVMTNAVSTRKPGRNADFSIVADADLQKSSGRPARLTDHARFYDGDTASTHIIKLAQGALAGAKRRSGGGGGVGGRGGSEVGTNFKIR